MDKHVVIKDLIALLSSHQIKIGAQPQEITPATCPHKDLPHFDSFSSISVTEEFFEKHPIKHDNIVSLFFTAEPRKQATGATLLTVEGAADRVCTLVPSVI